MSAEIPSKIIAGIHFVGRGGGQVKALAGFKKGHHTVPDAANATTNGFLAKICADELASEAEEVFQKTRAGLGYKRKDISLSVTSPLAVLTARDFVYEIEYALRESDPAQYDVRYCLRDVSSAEVGQGDAFNALFAARFTEISFALRKAARIEAVIDVIENLSDEPHLGVDYPSDCHECTIRVEGVDAEVRCTASSLDMVFPRAGAPRELIEAFLQVRSAFAVAPALSGILK